MNETVPTTKGRTVTTGVRLIAGIAVIAAGLAGVALAIAAPLPQWQGEAARVGIAPHAEDTTLVCAGQFRAIGRDPASPIAMQGVGTVALTVASEQSPPEQTALAIPELDATSAPAVLRATAENGQTPMIAASQSLVLREADLFGLAAAPCRAPDFQAWLVGGAVSLGTSDLLVLSNPGQVASTVTATVYSVASQNSRTVIVPPRSQIAVLLAESAGGQSAPVVRLSAEGAPIHAVLQSSLMRTLDPAGVALQESAGMPDTRQVIAGVQIVAESEEALALVRLMATSADTVATVRVYAAGEPATPVMEQSAPLVAASPVELLLESLAPGTYAIVVEASEPFVAAAWQTTGHAAMSDFSWMTPAPAVQGELLFAIPEGQTSGLHLVNDSGTSAEYIVRDARGFERAFALPEHTSLLVPMTPGAGYTLIAATPVRAAITMAGDDALAGWPLWPERGGWHAIVVFP